MMSAKAKKLAPPQVILVPTWAVDTAPYLAFVARVSVLAGGYTITPARGAWKPLKTDEALIVEDMQRVEARVSMQDYENDTRLDRTFDDFARFLLTREHEVYRERGPLAWIEPR